MTLFLTSIQSRRGIRRLIGPKRIILLLSLAAFVVWAWSSYRSGALSPSILEQYRDQYPIGTVLIFLLVYAISVIAALPSLPLNLAAGYFWGGLVGGAYSAIGVTFGGWISFLAARWLVGQPLAEHFDNKWAGKVHDEFKRYGWKFVAFARLNPIIPTGPLNYLLGLTSLSNRGFLWATFTFLLPPSIAVAYIGDTFQTFTAQQNDANDIIRGILIISAAVTFLVLIKFAPTMFRDTSGQE